MTKEILHWLIDTGKEIKIACGNKDEEALVIFSKHKVTCKECLKH